MIEKPLSRNLEGIEILKKNVENNLVVLWHIFLDLLHSPNDQKFIQENALGKIYYVRGEFSEYCLIGILMRIIEVFIWLKNQWVEAQF